MKTIAVIAELNPLHNGHCYLFEEARRQSGADHLIVVLSGNYVQRGEPAVIDKYTRTRHALLAGADLVVELPLAAACSSAQRFAEGAVNVLQHLGCVDELWFGAESTNTGLLHLLGDILTDEPKEYKKMLQQELAKGLSFPNARSLALCRYISTLPEIDFSTQEISDFLKGSNNILALEYILALKKYHSTIKPCTIQRMGSAYSDTEMTVGQQPSASAIREALYGHTDTDRSVLSASVPTFVHEDLQSRNAFLSAENFSDVLLTRLIDMQDTGYASILDISEDFSNRIQRELMAYQSFSQFAEHLSTRNYPAAACRRALLHIALQITPDDLRNSLHTDDVHVLGFRKGSGALLLHRIQEIGTARLQSKPVEYMNPTERDADLLYEAMAAKAENRAMVHPFRRSIVVL